jgi:GAF domain-containing protein
MEPIPETNEAVNELEPSGDDEDDLLEELLEKGHRVRELVPDCVGLSLASMSHRVTFTLVASDAEIAVLDAVQYLAGGPCVEAAGRPRVLEFDHEDDVRGRFPSESRWQTFAEATAAHGVQSTLTLPIMNGEAVVGTVNLYARSRRAFSGLHEEIAEIFGAWAPGAVTNADLGFTTRQRAEEAPAQLRSAARISTAAGILSATRDVDEDAARAMLRDAARRAGVDEEQLAEVIIELHQHD